MDFDFDFDYPLFAVYQYAKVDADNVTTMHALATLTIEIPDIGYTEALAVFTDKEGAEDFRDANCPENDLFRILDARSFDALLVFASAVTTHVGFDPWHPDKGIQTITIDELRRNLH